jgi:hypothetical protein
MPGTITGALGQVKHAYQTAALITDYHIAKDDLSGAWLLTGTVAQSDAYLLTQSPLFFVMRGGARWPVLAWSMTAGQCAATVALPT